MKILTEIEQYEAQLDELEKTIEWQRHRVLIAKRRLSRKQDWMFSFILSTEMALTYESKVEYDIHNYLRRYHEALVEELRKLVLVEDKIKRNWMYNVVSSESSKSTGKLTSKYTITRDEV